MAWEIVAVGIGSVAVTGVITIASAVVNGRLAKDRTTDDHDFEIKRETLRRRLKLRQENLKPLREVIDQLTVIVDRYDIARQRSTLLGDPAGNPEAEAAAAELKSLRETTGPQPWWTVPDEKLAALCKSLYGDIGNLELTLASSRFAEFHGMADVHQANLARTRTAIAKRMEELISGSDLNETP